MPKSKLRFALLALLYSLVFLGIGYVMAIFVANRNSNYNLQDVMFIEGLLVVVVGLMLSMKGNPSGISLHGLGQTYAQYTANWNLEVTRIERDSTDYYKKFLQHSVVELAFSSLVFIIGGIFIILFSIFCVR
jgi:hypothetical protein